LAAVEDGSVPQRRLDSWRKLGREAEWIASRSDYRVRQQRAARWAQLRRESGATRVDPARRR
jgi:ribosome biogenesis GTPase